jgi:hypothetical protein
VRRVLQIFTVCSAVLFLAIAGVLSYTNYRCRTETRYRPSVETTIAGANWQFYVAPAGLGLTIKHASEPTAVTGAMDVEQWRAWSLQVMGTDRLHQFAGFSLLLRGSLYRSDLDRPTRTFIGYDVGWWRAVLVPAWAAMAIPGVLPMAMLIRWFRRVRAKAPAGFPGTAPTVA